MNTFYRSTTPRNLKLKKIILSYVLILSVFFTILSKAQESKLTFLTTLEEGNTPNKQQEDELREYLTSLKDKSKHNELVHPRRPPSCHRI